MDARTEAEGRELKGNQYIAKGIKGKRINRQTEQTEERTNSLIDIRGSSYTALVIHNIIARSITLETCKDEDAMKKIYESYHRIENNIKLRLLNHENSNISGC